MSTDIESPKETLLSAEHPYAKRLEESLQEQKNYLILLESKIEDLTRTIERANPDTIRIETSLRLELTEKKINKYKTQAEITSIKKVIFEKENYFKGYMEQFVKDEAEVNLRYKHTVDIAKKSTKPNVQKLLSRVKWERIEGDIEAKIALYKQLKKYV